MVAGVDKSRCLREHFCSSTCQPSPPTFGCFLMRPRPDLTERSPVSNKEGAMGDLGKPGTELGPDAPFDAVLARLQELVQQLEEGDLPLEASLALFEEGVRLSRV